MKVKATTKVYAIIGHPVSHSLSPVMHNAAFESLSLDCVYVAFDIQPRDLEPAARAIRAFGISGVNVTIPHKESILFFLDEVSQEAALTGAVNTIKNEEGKLVGYNTDVAGFLRAIEEDLGVNPKGISLVLIGAGGAARAVLSGMCMKGATRIYIANRTLDKAKKLASEFKKAFKDVFIEGISLYNKNGLEEALSKSTLLVNSTSAGMKGTASPQIPLELLPKDAVIYDLIYTPRETELVKRAKQLGYRAAGGLNMLLYQGAESFEIWTGKKAPIEVMREVIEKELLGTTQ